MPDAIALTGCLTDDTDDRVEALESRLVALESFVNLVVTSHQDQLTSILSTVDALAGLLAQQNAALAEGQKVMQAVVDHLAIIDHEAAEGPSEAAATADE